MLQDVITSLLLSKKSSNTCASTRRFAVRDLVTDHRDGEKNTTTLTVSSTNYPEDATCSL